MIVVKYIFVLILTLPIAYLSYVLLRICGNYVKSTENADNKPKKKSSNNGMYIPEPMKFGDKK